MSVLNEILDRLLNLIPRIITVCPEESGVRVTLGSHMKDCGPGWYIVWPLIQELNYIVVSPSVTDVAYVDARTKNGTPLVVGVSLMYHVVNARSAIFSVNSFEDLLNVIGADAARAVIEKSTDGGLPSVEGIRKAILDEARSSCRGWGIKIDRVLLPCCTPCRALRIIGNTRYTPE